MYSGNELKVGVKFIMDDQPYEVTSYSQKVVGRGGSIINIKAKNLLTGGNIPKTFSDKDRFAPAEVSRSNYEYLYNDGTVYYFMNATTYEQVEIQSETVGDAKYFLVEGEKISLQEFNGNPINIDLPPSTILEVEDTPPGEKGDTATGGKKPATMNTGLVVQVPLFVNPGDKISVDTRTKEYLSRA